VDELASRIIIAQKNALNLLLDDITKEFSFQNGFGMEALDTANTSNGH
jgi:hypothetical protein